jgi:RNA polymerase sigma factor (sigma-70 family)
MGDFTLLQAYVNRRSEDAFTELVNRNIHLVYSAALRQTRDPHAAAEVAQTVFIILARKAHTIREGAILSGWLLRTTRFTAANARRREQRRQNTEHQAMDNLCANENETDWKQIAPLLDEALVALGEQDRNAVALRFFDQKSYKEIGAALSLSEDSARKRVSRALERLRTFLSRRGKVLPAAVLAGAMSAHAVKAAPPELAGNVAIMALSRASVAPSALPLLARGTLGTLKWMQWKTVAIGASLAGLALCIVVLMGAHYTSEQIVPPVPAAVTAEVHAADEKTGKPGNQAITASPAQETASTSEHKMLFSVMNSETGRPVANARLTLTWVADFPHRRTNIFTTDRRGESLVSIDHTPIAHWNSRIEVFKDGYVPKYVSWSESQGDAIEDLPLEYKTKLAPGVDIGGLVLNDKGEPIPDVRVVFTVSGTAPGASHDRERLTMMGHYHTEITDAQGHWHCNHVPSQFEMITYQLFHPDYIAEIFGAAAAGAISSGGMNYVGEADLRNDSAVFVLKRGLIVAGVVVDESGNPVANAKVTENRDWREASANQLTGADGRFRFANLPHKELILSMQADGFAPTDMTLHPSEKAEELRLPLSKGWLLEGRVVDEAGNPIAKARLHVGADEFDRRFEWSTATDEQGRFEWLSAPMPRGTYVVEAAGYASESNVGLDADGSEHLVTLHRNAASASFRVSGTAVDAATGRPIKDFQVMMSTTESWLSSSGDTNFSISSPELQTTGKSGKFSFQTSSSALSNLLEVRADGYLPAQSARIGSITADCEFDFQLKSSADIAGAVQLPEGTPAVGAMVMLCTQEAAPQMTLPAQFDLTRSGNAKHAETDAEGRFSFKPQLGVEKIRVAHIAGYAEVSLEDLALSRTIVLRPWGRVEGALRIGGEPGSDQKIELSNWYWRFGVFPCFQLHMETKTDTNGHFVFEGVPPGEREVWHSVNLRPDKTGLSISDSMPIHMGGRAVAMRIRPWAGQSQNMLVQVQAGQTAQITLGGTGRTVVGRIKANNSSQQIDWQKDVQTIRSKVSRPDAPKREDFASEAEYATAKEGWIAGEREFWLSEAGREAQRKSRHYMLVFATDGSFRINDVAPGTYWFNVGVSDPSALGTSIDGKTIGSVQKDVIVPEASGNESSPVDLGAFELVP